MTDGGLNESLRRVVIEDLSPEIDGGRFPVKRCPGEAVAVRACIHADSHDLLAAVVQWRGVKDKEWADAPLDLVNAGLDLWEGRFTVDAIGRFEYSFQAWVDRFAGWRRDLKKKTEAGQDVASDLLEGARLVKDAAGRADGKDTDWLRKRVEALSAAGNLPQRIQAALDPELESYMRRYPDRSLATTSRPLPLTVESERARFGAWYEMFPRSHVTTGRGPAPAATRSGTLKEAESRLVEIARLGFDVVYLPPIHPIGESFRKGPNNDPKGGPEAPGSPWAIGSAAGGHKAVDPHLGTLEDFDHFVRAAGQLGLEVALDLAFQCSPDHPYVKEHPEWFRHRPDGTIKYAENPPKKYEDIYPLDFEGPAWQALWQELLDVVLFWVKRGVSIFRVDNPHTKPYRFWEWLIHEVHDKHPRIIFLAEAFTRPPVMRYLAKAGFSQSYTYFTWRNTKAELTEYVTELTQTPVREYMRPNFFANTPDILSEFLQKGGRNATQIRFLLAATLSSAYGIYGPPFELAEVRGFPGTEDYVDSEKYQIRVWDWDRPGNIKPLIGRVNRIRRENPALQYTSNVRFYEVDNPQLLFFGKESPDRSNSLLIVINLDPSRVQSGWLKVPWQTLGLPESYEVHDLLSDARFRWQRDANFVMLDPNGVPAHLLRIR
jgi:starch synthase (maltosyl-transferring)